METDSRKPDKTRDTTKEELILNAASEVFVEKGLSGARMQEIANRAGINKTLLHYYFRTKENIYAKIVDMVFSKFFGQMETALTDGASFPEALRGFIDGIFSVMVANPRVPLFMMQELAHGGKLVRDILLSTLTRNNLSLPKRFFSTLEEESAAGRIAPVDPFQFMITLIGSCIYFFVAEPIVAAIVTTLSGNDSFDRVKFVDERKQAIFNVIYYGVKKRGEHDEAHE